MSELTWCRISNAFPDNPKVLRVGPNAAYLWLVSIAWASRNLTDGFIPTQQIKRLVDWDDIIEVRRDGRHKGEHRFVQATELVARLVEAGLWEQVTDGYRIHDFLHWQRSKARVEQLRQERAERGRRGGLASAAKRDQANAQPKVKQSSSKVQPDTDTDTDNFLKPLSDESDARLIFDAWIKSTGKNGQTTRFSDKRRKIVNAALKEYPVDDLLDAVEGWRKSPHHRGENRQLTVYNDLELLLRDAQHIEKFRDLNRAPSSEPRGDGFAERLKAATVR